jgi:hypothetical protein
MFLSTIFRLLFVNWLLFTPILKLGFVLILSIVLFIFGLPFPLLPSKLIWHYINSLSSAYHNSL